jgi:hypothetical protein
VVSGRDFSGGAVHPFGMALEEELHLGPLDAETRQLGAGRAGVSYRTLLTPQL